MFNILELYEACRENVNDIRKGEEAKLKRFTAHNRLTPIANAIRDDEEFLSGLIMDMDDVIKKIRGIF